MITKYNSGPNHVKIDARNNLSIDVRLSLTFKRRRNCIEFSACPRRSIITVLINFYYYYFYTSRFVHVEVIILIFNLGVMSVVFYSF
jgi:hypothetical protein